MRLPVIFLALILLTVGGVVLLLRGRTIVPERANVNTFEAKNTTDGDRANQQPSPKNEAKNEGFPIATGDLIGKNVVVETEVLTPKMSADDRGSIRISLKNYKPQEGIPHISEDMLRDAWLEWRMVGESPHTVLRQSGVRSSNRNRKYAQGRPIQLPAIGEFPLYQYLTNGSVVRPGEYEACVVFPTETKQLKSAPFRVQVGLPKSWPEIQIELKAQPTALNSDGSVELTLRVKHPAELPQISDSSKLAQAGVEWTRTQPGQEVSTTRNGDSLTRAIVQLLRQRPAATGSTTEIALPLKDYFADSESRVGVGQYQMRVSYSDDQILIESNSVTFTVAPRSENHAQK